MVPRNNVRPAKPGTQHAGLGCWGELVAVTVVVLAEVVRKGLLVGWVLWGNLTVLLRRIAQATP